MRIERLVLLFSIGLGSFCIILGLSAGKLGFDPNNGWGPRRIFVFMLGCLLLTISIIYLNRYFLLDKLSNKKYIKFYFIFFAYAVISGAFLSPLASDEVVPGFNDVVFHISGIRQAKMAMEEGQFPIRVAPSVNLGYRYAFYQFYSPVAFTVAGLIDSLLSPENPFLAYKICLFFALLISGIYMFRLTFSITGSIRSAFLAGVLYMTGPYLLQNIHARTAWTESLAQGLLPVVLYYTFALYKNFNSASYIKSSITWFLLCGIHLITFVYTIIFLTIILVFLTWPLKKNCIKVILVYLSILLGSLLIWTYLEPILLTPLAMKTGLGNPYVYNWLSKLSTLISPVSVPPEPTGVLSRTWPGTNMSVGWVSLVGVAYLLYGILTNKFNESPLFRNNRHLVLGLLLVYALSFFMAWSPIDFWQYLPRELWVIQFPYRMLSQIMWSGAILCSFTFFWLLEMVGQKDIFTLGLSFLIVYTHASWMIVYDQPQQYQKDIGPFNQQLHYTFPQSEINNGIKLDVGVDEMKDHCIQQGITTICDIETLNNGMFVQLPVYYYPGSLEITVNGSEVQYFPTKHIGYYDVLTGIHLQNGQNKIAVVFVGSTRANIISLIAWCFLLLMIMGLSSKYLLKYWKQYR